MIEEGHPLFTLLAGAELHGLPTGHWPMFSEPKRLAEILDAIGRGTADQDLRMPRISSAISSGVRPSVLTVPVATCS
jgi:hypothetical protein